LKGYSGTYSLINDYLATAGSSTLTFGNIYSSKYTTAEFEAIKHMEQIFPNILGYRFYTFMKLGLIN
jgi:hypothetical protein